MVKRTIYIILLFGISCTPFYPTIYLDKNFDHTKSPLNYNGFYTIESEHSQNIEALWFYRNGLVRSTCCSDSLTEVESKDVSFFRNSPYLYSYRNKNPVGWGIHWIGHDTLYMRMYEIPTNGRVVNPDRVNYYGKIFANQPIIMFHLPGKKKWRYPREPFALNFYETTEKPDSTNSIISTLDGQ